MSQHSDSWWMGTLAAEVGHFLAGIRDVGHLHSVYRDFYASEQVQHDEEFRSYLTPPPRKKVKVRV